MKKEETRGNLAEAIAAGLLEKAGLSPREALQHIVGSRAGNVGSNHVGRDVGTLQRLGLRPLKVCGRWVVPLHELARWAAGEAEQPASQAKPRGPGRPRKSNAGGAL